MLLAPLLFAAATGWYSVAGKPMLLTYSAQGDYSLIDFEKPSMTDVAEGKAVTVGDSKVSLVLRDGRFEGASRSKSQPYSVRELTFRNQDVELSGTLFKAKTNKVGAVLIHGSGNSDRDGFWYLEHAHALASAGINVLLPDKRGCGKSGGDWKISGFTDYARDAIAGAEAMKKAGVKEVGFIGLSQGGWVSPLAASLWPKAAFVVTISSAAVTPAEQVDHEMANTFREMGLSGEDFDQAQKLQRLAGDVIRKNDWNSYNAYRQQQLAGKLKALAEGFPGTPDHWMWNWYRENGSFDMIPIVERLRQPMLAVFGRKDEQDNVPVSTSVEMLTKARKGKKGPALTIVVYDESGHGIGDPATGRVRKQHLAGLADWILQATASK